MRTTVNLNDALLRKAQRLTGIEERTALIHADLKVLTKRESARRLARLGGSEPQLEPVLRRRPDADPKSARSWWMRPFGLTTCAAATLGSRRS